MIKFETDEHFYSGWIRHCMLHGFAALPVGSALSMFGIQPHQMQPQRVLGRHTNDMIDTFFPNSAEAMLVRKKRTIVSLWVLSDSRCVSQLHSRYPNIRPNNEHLPFSFSSGWKLCKACAEEERNQIGFSYWHREHQLPSMAYCLEHALPLSTHTELRYFKRFTLPHRNLAESTSIIDRCEGMLEWSRFIRCLDKKLLVDDDFSIRIKRSAHDYLEIPKKVQQRDRAYFNDLMKKMEDDLGGSLLGYLFKSYRAQRKARQNIIWTLLSGNSSAGLIHPLYWAVLLYWLRYELVEMGEVWGAYTNKTSDTGRRNDLQLGVSSVSNECEGF